MKMKRIKVKALAAVVLSTVLIGAASANTVAEFLEDAQSYIEKKEYRTAVIQLKNALQQDPKSMEARKMLADVYLLQGEAASAEKEYLRIRDLQGKQSDWFVGLADAYLKLNKAHELKAELDRLTEVDEDIQAEVFSLRALISISEEDLSQAQKMLDKALAVDQNSARALYAQAQLYRVDGRPGEAAKVADKLLKAHPAHVEGLLLKATLARAEGKPEEAEKFLNRALNVNPDSLMAVLALAEVEIQLGKHESAYNRVQPILKRNPNFPQANYVVAYVELTRNNIAKADSSIDLVLRAFPRHLPAMVVKAYISHQKKAYEQAATLLSQVLEAQPNHIPAVKLYASTLLELKRPQDAVEVLESAVRKNNKDAELVSALGQAHLASGDVERGTEMLEKAVKLAPDLSKLRTRLGFSYLLQGESDQAVKNLSAVEGEGADAVASEVLLIMALVGKQDYAGAIKTAKEFAKKQPKNPIAFNLIGIAQLKQGNHAAARKAFNDALKVDPKYTAGRVNLAKMDEDDGELKSARKHYERVLQDDRKHMGALLAISRLEERQGNKAEALAWLRKAVERNPEAVGPSALLARYYLTKNEPDKVLEVLRSLEDKEGDHPIVLELLGNAQLMAGQDHNALNSYRKLVDVADSSPNAHFLYARALLKVEDTRAARKHLERSSELDEKYLPSRLVLAKLAVEDKRYKDAQKIAKHVQKVHDKIASGFMIEGDVHAAQKNYAKALAAYEKAFSKQRDERLVMQISAASEKLGQHAKAKKTLSDWVKANPKSLSASMRLASLYQGSGENQKAIALYDAILKMDSKQVVALNNIAWLLAVQKDQRALDLAKRAYTVGKEIPSVIDTYGWVLMQFGQVSKALPILQEALIKAPHEADIRFHLAQALEKSGRKQEALAEVRRALDTQGRFSERANAQALLSRLEK